MHDKNNNNDNNNNNNNNNNLLIEHITNSMLKTQGEGGIETLKTCTLNNYNNHSYLLIYDVLNKSY